MIFIVVAAAAVLLAAVALLVTQVFRPQNPVDVVPTPVQSRAASARPSPVTNRTATGTGTASGSAGSVRPTSQQPIPTPTSTAVMSLPAGTWITVLESLPKNEFSLVQAEAKAASLSVAGHPVSVIDSDAIPGLNKGYWALGVPGGYSREAAVALCDTFGRQAGGTCYPRQVG